MQREVFETKMKTALILIVAFHVVLTQSKLFFMKIVIIFSVAGLELSKGMCQVKVRFSFSDVKGFLYFLEIFDIH